MYRDRKLLDLAKGEKCLLQISPKCLGEEGSTTVAAHSNFWEDGKGMGIKAEDCYSVWACVHCHSLLDQGMMRQTEKEKAFYEGFHRQMLEWAQIADNICLKPWKVDAARNVLQYLGEKHGTNRSIDSDSAAWSDQHPYPAPTEPKVF